MLLQLILLRQGQGAPEQHASRDPKHHNPLSEVLAPSQSSAHTPQVFSCSLDSIGGGVAGAQGLKDMIQLNISLEQLDLEAQVPSVQIFVCIKGGLDVSHIIMKPHKRGSSLLELAEWPQ